MIDSGNLQGQVPLKYQSVIEVSGAIDICTDLRHSKYSTNWLIRLETLTQSKPKIILYWIWNLSVWARLLAPQKVKLTNNTACFFTSVSCLYTSIVLRWNTVVKNTFHYNCSLLCKQVAQLSRRVIRLSYIAQCAYAYIGTSISLSLSFASFEKYS